MFASGRLRKKHVFPDLRVGQGAIQDAPFTCWRNGASSRGYLDLCPTVAMEPKVLEWIERAKRDQAAGSDEADAEDESGDAG